MRRQADTHEARGGHVALAPGGRRKCEEGLERAELLADELLPEVSAKTRDAYFQFLTELRTRAGHAGA